MAKVKPAFVEFIEEALIPVGARGKSMFGGWGMYVQDRMMGLIVEDVLYLKADAENVGMFQTANLEPFTYEGKDKLVQMSYYRAPEDLLEDWQALEPWVMGAIAASHRQKKPAKKSKG